MSEVKPDRLVIINKGRGARYEIKFFKEIQEAILGGYRIAETDVRHDASMRNYKGSIGRAVLYKQGTEPEKVVEVVKPLVEITKEHEVETPLDPIVEPTTEETTEDTDLETPSTEGRLEGLTKKSDLLDYAKELDIEIPEDAKVPQKIKKIIRESLKK